MSDSPAVILFDTTGTEKGLPDNPVSTAEQATSSGGYYPSMFDALPSLGYGETHVNFLDGGGNQRVRSAVLTDEGSVKDDFGGSSIDVNMTGTALFTANSKDVVGVGTLFTSELSRQFLLRRTGDASSFATRVSVVIDDTHVQLESEYPGTTGTSVPIQSVWSQVSDPGTSITVGSSEVVLASGTTSGSSALIFRPVDYSPMVCSYYGRISQRIVNQEIKIGVADDIASPINQAFIVFSGTDNTKCFLRTGSDSGDIETSAVFTLPNSATTAANHWYRMEVTPEVVSIYMDGILLGSAKLHIPALYGTLGMQASILNTGVPASSTSCTFDVISTSNFNFVQVGGGATSVPLAVEVGGVDQNGDFRLVTVKNSPPSLTDYGQVVRPTLNTVASASQDSINTSGTGSSYVVLASLAAVQVSIINNSGKDIEVRRNGAGVALPVVDGSYWVFRGITNANQLSLRRLDLSNSVVTVHYEVES